MDKLAIGFLADILYIKAIISFDEYDAIQKIKKAEDIQEVVDRMLRGDYSAHRKGEGYITTGTRG